MPLPSGTAGGSYAAIDGVRLPAAFKIPCIAATTGNIVLSGLQTIDGVSVASGDRVLVWVQSDATENGIYTASDGDWPRASDFDSNAEVLSGCSVYVSSGTLYGGQHLLVTSPDAIVIGDTAITFEAVARGPQGDPGVKGDTGPNSWSAPVAYASGINATTTPPATVCTYNGSAYVCTVSHTTTGTFDAGKWALIVSKGDPGTLAPNSVTAAELAPGAIVDDLGFTPATSTHTHSNATAGAAGFMSAADKVIVVRHEREKFDVTAGYGGTTWYGNGTDNDQPAIQAAIDAAEAAYPSVTEGPCAEIIIPPGYRVRVNDGITLRKPQIFKAKSQIYYHKGTGSAFVVGADASSTSITPKGYDVQLVGIRAMVDQNTSTPTGIDLTKSSGVEIRQAQFSRFDLGDMSAFKGRGVYINCTNDLNANWQHVQDCEIKVGESAYCGIGFDAQSADAAKGACQVNKIYIQNSHRNWKNLNLDQSGRNNTNNNMFFITAMDAAAGSYVGECYGLFNQFEIGYLDGTFYLRSSTYGNEVDVYNSDPTLADVQDQSGKNRFRTAAPESGNVLPYSKSVSLNTYYANDHGVPIFVNASFVLSPGAGTVYAEGKIKSPTGAEYAPLLAAAQPGAPANSVFPGIMQVPPGWEYKFVITGSSGALNGGAVFLQEMK